MTSELVALFSADLRRSSPSLRPCSTLTARRCVGFVNRPPVPAWGPNTASVNDPKLASASQAAGP
jgi:hypothetical protein